MASLGNTIINGTLKVNGKISASSFEGNLTGNASSATKLQTARTINGISFDGTKNITVADNTKLPLTGGTLTGHLYLNGIKESTLDTTTKIIFGNSTNHYGCIRCNTAGAIILSNSATDNTYGVYTKLSEFSPTTTNNTSLGTSNNKWSDIYTTKSHTGELIVHTGSTSGTVTYDDKINPRITFANSNSSQAVSLIFTDYDAYKAPYGLTLVGNGQSTTNGGAYLKVEGNISSSTMNATTFTGALSGNASSATKLATARKINGVSFDGTSDINIRKVAIVGSDAASSKGWYKAVSGNLTGYSNVSMLFAVHSTNDYCSGILQLDLRCDNGSTVGVKKFGWLTRYGFSTSNFIVNVSGNNWAIYENVTSNQYYRTMFEVIQEGGTSSFTASYTLHSNVTKESTAPTATVTSSDLATVANVSQKITASSKTHTNYNTNQGYLATMSFLSFWNGAYNSGGSSNLTYCHKGTICGSSDASTTNIRAMSASTYSSSASSLPNGSLVAVW
ncbi:MAG: hypothetical protein ACI4VQ_06850 [Clostridia bacterium]